MSSTDYKSLSDIQLRFWFDWQRNKKSVQHNTYIFYKLSGKLNTHLFAESVNFVLEKYKLFHSHFLIQNFEPVIFYDLKQHSKLEYIDLKQVLKDANPNQEKKYITKIIDKPIDLLVYPNFHIYLFESNTPQLFYFVTVVPHILLDAVSSELLFKNISNIYNKVEINDNLLTENIKTTSSTVSKEYWKDKLLSTHPILELTKTRKFFAPNYVGRRLYSELEGVNVKKLKKYARENKSTVFLVLMSIYSMLLYRYSDQRNFAILYPVNIRKRNQKNLLGSHINMLPAKINIANEAISLSEFIKEITDQRREDVLHQDFLIFDLYKEIRKIFGVRDGLFNVFFSKTKFYSHEFKFKDVNVDFVPYPMGTTGYDLGLLFDIQEDRLCLCVEFNSNKYSKWFAKQLLSSLENVIENLNEYSDYSIQHYPYISTEEQRELLTLSQTKSIEYPANKLSIYSQFHNICKKYPDRIALNDGDQSFSYKELELMVRKFCRVYIDFGMKQGDKVALLLDRNRYFVISIIALCRLNCTYIPLDIKMPVTRVEYILSDSKSNFLILDNLHSKIKGTENCKHIYLQDIIESAVLPLSGEDDPKIGKESLLYIIYTSGTTGEPKGVPIKHCSLVDLFQTADTMFNFSYEDVWSVSHSFAFDFSVWKMWGALLHGAKMVIVPDKVTINAKNFYEFIVRNQITVLSQTPSSFKGFSVSDQQEKNFLALRYVVFGGEKLNLLDLDSWVVKHGNKKPELINMYGLTEATIHATFYRITKRSTHCAASIIGKPLPGSIFYVVDKNGNLVPSGVLGEIWLSSARITPGYLNKDELNLQKFTLNVFDEQNFFYKTGDYAWWDKKSNLIYVGRKDKQIQYHGYRVELDEITYALQKLEAVNSSVSIVYSPNDMHQYIVTFCVAEDERTFEKDIIMHYLRSCLPHYMLPSELIFIPKLSLTTQGKVDTNYLEKLAETQFKMNLPSLNDSELLSIVSKIWENTLGIKKIDVNKNFFDMGGDSISLSKLHYQLEILTSSSFSINDLFQYTTIQSQAEFLSKLKEYSNFNIKSLIANQKNNRTGPVKSRSQNNNDIAVIGISLKFPGADSLSELWQILVEGKETITFFSKEELLEQGYDETLFNSKKFVGAKGYIAGADTFDAEFFGLSNKEAELIDPQHRIFLEYCWTALEDAGYTSETHAGKIGIFGAQSQINSYLYYNILKNKEVKNLFSDYQIYINNSSDFLSTRVAYKLNLTGPCMTIQSGCSSSLVAICQASQSLINKECDLALAGSVTLTMPLKSAYLYEEGMILSPDGHCRAFDDNANGTVPGNGIGIIVLKRLDDAISDRDHIYGVIKGFATNNDGSKKLGFTSPSKHGQSEVIKSALEKANCVSNSIDYIEAHGTGTKMGDPIELEALDEIFEKRSNSNPYYVGSIKTNIGHLDATSGIAGFIKALLCLNKKQLVPNVHFRKLNVNFHLQDSNFKMLNHSIPWESEGHPRRAGISSFAIGGTNAHVVLEEYKEQSNNGINKQDNLFIFSAKSKNTLEQLFKRYIGFISNEEFSLNDLAYTLQVGRESFAHRSAIVASSIDELRNALLSDPPILKVESISPHPIYFMFPGEATPNLSMIKSFYEKLPFFKKYFDECALNIIEISNFELRNIFQSENPNLDDNFNKYHYFYIFSFEYALAKNLISCGIIPVGLIGHGLGDYVAACVSEILSLKNSLLLLNKREEVIKQLPANQMVSVLDSFENLKKYIVPELNLVSINSDHHCVISGERLFLDKFIDELKSSSISFQELSTKYPCHVSNFQNLLNEFQNFIELCKFKIPNIPLISSVTGEWLTEEDLSNSAYWVEHLSKPILFAKGVKQLLKTSNSIFVEIGASKELSNYVKQIGDEVIALPIFMSQKNEFLDYLACLGTLWQYGCTLNWEQINASNLYHRISIPTYPFERRRFWIEPDECADVESKNLMLNIYQPYWKIVKEKQNEINNDKADNRVFIVFLDDDGEGEKLFTNAYKLDLQWFFVGDKKLHSKNEKHFLINFDDANAYNKLFSLLPSTNNIEIIYLCALGLSYETSMLLRLIYLMRSLKHLSAKRSITINIITNSLFKIQAEDSIDPKRSLLLGPALTIHQECPSIFARTIELASPMSNNYDHYFKQIMNEIFSANKDNLIAFRKNNRLVRNYSELIFNFTDNKIIKKDGVYIITGGLGHIGLVLAQCIAHQQKVKIFLLQRSDFPDKNMWDELLASNTTNHTLKEKLNKISALENSGSEVFVVKVDVGNKIELAEAINSIVKKYSSINGIVHAAGIAKGNPIDQVKEDDLRQILHAKVEGAINLHQVLESMDLDFMLLCSSLSAIRGDYGQSIYNAANSFLDAFAHWRTEFYGLTISLNWDAWKEGGMAHQFYKSIGRLEDLNYAISDSQVQPIFNEIISRYQSQFLVTAKKMFSDKNTTPKSKIKDETSKRFTSLLRPNSREEITQLIMENWKKYFGIRELGIDDNYFNLGGDSLLAVQLIKTISTDINIELDPNILLEYPTVETLVDYIMTLKQKSKSPLIKMKETKSKESINLFLIHPIGGTTYIYKDLVDYFHESIRVYSIQSTFLEDNQFSNKSVPELARDYILAIRAVQPQGPYYIGGASFGGTVAYEMAQQFYRLNEKIPYLFMIDTPSYEALPKLTPNDSEIIAYLLEVGEQHWVESNFYKMDLHQQLDYFVTHAGAVYRMIDKYDYDTLKRYLAVFKANMLAMATYQPVYYKQKGNVGYFKALEHDRVNSSVPETGWRILIPSEHFLLKDITGNHITMLLKSNARKIAETINSIFLNQFTLK